MLNIIQKYISRIISQEVPVKMPFDIVTYLFKENLERNFRGNEEIVDRYFNPLEEICKKQDLEEPKKMITDLKTGGLVLYRGEKRFILTEKQINEAFGEAFEKYRIMR